jgi:heterotetrameric sarcosine oxidase gamma subunit
MLFRENVLKESTIKYNNVFGFEELCNIYKINLRGNSSDKIFTTNIEKILETPVPIEPNTINNNNRLKIIWLGPNEWLIEIYELKDFEKIFLKLKSSLNSQSTALTDITDSKTILKLSGIHLYKLLAKFMIIDLHKILNKELAVAQTIFIKVPIMIIRNHKNDKEQSILLYTNRSHAQYIIDLLLDGSKNINF